MSKEHPREVGYYVGDRNTGMIHRGTYKCMAAAVAVCAEMERQGQYDHMNLWPIDHLTADNFDEMWLEHHPAAAF